MHLISELIFSRHILYANTIFSTNIQLKSNKVLENFQMVLDFQINLNTIQG